MPVMKTLQRASKRVTFCPRVSVRLYRPGKDDIPSYPEQAMHSSLSEAATVIFMAPVAGRVRK